MTPITDASIMELAKVFEQYPMSKEVTLRGHGIVEFARALLAVLEVVRRTNTPRLEPQHVLKAEAARPDATDRGMPATTTPRGGAMGMGQPAAAGSMVQQ